MSSLEINYRTKKLEKKCENYKTAVCSYGRDMASKIAQRIGEIRAIDAVEYLVKCEIGRCHPLNGNRQGEYAMDLVHPYRLIFTVENGTVQIATIMEIKDYH